MSKKKYKVKKYTATQPKGKWVYFYADSKDEVRRQTRAQAAKSFTVRFGRVRRVLFRGQ